MQCEINSDYFMTNDYSTVCEQDWRHPITPNKKRVAIDSVDTSSTLLLLP